MRTYRYGFVLAMCAATMLGATPLAVANHEESLFVVHVVGPDGAAVEGAEAFLVDVAYGFPITRVWTGAEGDLITIAADNISHYYEDEAIEGDIRLIVRAPGHAWSLKQLPHDSDGPIEVALDEGRVITLRFETDEGVDLPDGFEPVVYTETLGTPTWLTCVQGFQRRLNEPGTAMIAGQPKSLGNGDYQIRIPVDVEQVHVLIDHPGFLRIYEHGPIVIADLAESATTIELPQPVVLNIEVSPEQDAPAQYEACGVSVMHSPTSPGGWSFHVGARYDEGTEFQTSYDDLAPGIYSVDAFTGTKETRSETDRPDYCKVSGYADLTGEATGTVSLNLQTYDEAYWKDKLRGDYNLTLDLNLNDGTPAAGKAYEVAFALRQFSQQLVIAGGTVPEDGLIPLTDLPPGKDAMIVVLVNDDYVDQIYLRGEELDQTMTYALAPEIGDRAPNFEFTGLASGESHHLADLKGQVVFLEFWATWCGPCQEPMLHNNELMKRRGESWRDRVTILGVSIDEEIETIREHVDKRDWNAVRQVWVPDAWKAAPVKAYAVTGVPSAFLIDADGIILWVGHPAEIELEKRIEELLQD